MDEWEILLFVCIVGMFLLATIAFLFAVRYALAGRKTRLFTSYSH
jgi:hypothetical protein